MYSSVLNVILDAIKIIKKSTIKKSLIFTAIVFLYFVYYMRILQVMDHILRFIFGHQPTPRLHSQTYFKTEIYTWMGNNLAEEVLNL